MNDDPTTKAESRAHSRWVGWTLALLAVPVLYVLTAPPIVYSGFTGRKLGPLTIDQGWALAYGKPYKWMAAHTPLQGLLKSYQAWWIVRFNTPS